MDENISKKAIPDLHEWRKQNPGKTINDYLGIYGSISKTHPYPINQEPYIQDVVPIGLRSKRKIIWPYILIPLFIAIAFFSNPKKEEHKDALKIKLLGVVEEKMSENTDNLFFIGLGKSIGGLVIDEVLKSVSVDNYIFFSITKYNFGSDSNIIGFGCLGKVYISDKINRAAIENYINKQKNE